MTEGQTLTVDYSFDNLDERGQLRRANSRERHDGQVEHLWRFGKDRVNDMRSNLIYYNETGLFPLDRIRLLESLRVRPTRKFELRGDYLFDQQKRTDSRQRFHRATGGFRHQLFESLTTNAEAGASHFHVREDDFQSDQYFGQASFDYIKEVPYGRINAGGVVNINHTDDSASGGNIGIADEAHIFGPSGIVVLNARNIITDSIVVTDGAGIFRFDEGLDYSVRALADRVELRRILGGRIADGQTVLVDYTIGPEPGGSTDTVGIGGTIRYDIEEGSLRGLGLYARYFNQSQDRDTDALLILPPSDFEDIVYGIDYEAWLISLLAERQIHDSELSPYEGYRIEGRLTYEIGRGSSLALIGTYRDLDFTDDDIQTQVTTFTGLWYQQLTPRLRSGVRLIWRDEQDSQGVDVEAWEQWIDLTWEYRQTMIYGRFRHTMLDSDFNETTSQTLVVGVRRDF
jgi:hypothetical protein